MTKSELSEILKTLTSKFKSIEKTLNLETKQSKINSLQKITEKPGFWNDQEKAQEVSQNLAHFESFIKTWSEIKNELKDLPELLEIASKKELPEIETEVQTFEKLFLEEETKLLFSGKYDRGNAILSIHVGNGGQDAEDFCQMLFRMYLRFCEQKKFKIKILEESTSESGLKSATIEISGEAVYGFLQSENGVHRLIRLSPFNAKNLRQTSFSKIEVLPMIKNDTDVHIEEKNLRIDVFRSSGCGGQSVNTTDSAVRITYLPLNLVVSCQNEKSQLQNKAAAMKVLKSRLLQLKIEQQTQKIEELRGEKMDAAFGSQIRTYTLHPYKLVKDHRTNYEENNPEKVFDGEINGFIQAFLRNK
ncbi:peptide chain release factor 2 [Candidatus Gracilibacteria bacterium]|nr:peptide chain release factor 2 [Candidatus Gracilibacteria bacterium]